MGNTAEAHQKACRNKSGVPTLRSEITVDQGNGLDRTDGRLLACLSNLVDRHGAKGAAQQLGVGYQTVRRALATEDVKRVLQKALERYLLAENSTGRFPWWVQGEELRGRIDVLESHIQHLAYSLEETRRAVLIAESRHKRTQAELAERLSRLERQIQELAGQRDRGGDERIQVPVQQAREPSQSKDQPDATPVAGVDESSNGSARTPEVAELVEARREALAAEQTARTEIERLKASQRMLEIELTLIRKHGETWPPGKEWTRLKRGDELSWRWHTLDYVQARRRRFERRRWVRRVLTLGLWWR